MGLRNGLSRRLGVVEWMLNKNKWIVLSACVFCCMPALAELHANENDPSSPESLSSDSPELTPDKTPVLDVEWFMSGAFKLDGERASETDFSTYTRDASLWAGAAPIGGWQTLGFDVDQELDEPSSEWLWQSAAPDSGSGGAASAENMDAIAEALANPLSYLWLAFMQNDTIWYDGDVADALGEDAKAQNTFLLNPVISMQLTEQWKMVVRPVIPINSFETVDNVNLSVTNPGQVTGVNFARETGLGDIVLWTAFSKQYTPPFIFGFGPTIMLDTASDDFLGTGKNSAGPMALAVGITEKWIVGAVAQHWWSFSGSDSIEVETTAGPVRVERPDVNLTDIQPIVRYRLSAKTNIGMAPNWRYNHETSQLSLPIGIGFDTLVTFGKLPVKIGLEAYYYVEKDDDFGPDWQLRFLFVPVLPSPAWSRNPIF